MKKILVFTLCLFAVWNVLLAAIDPAPYALNQWQNNIVATQTYLYQKDIPDTVIIGSSLSQRLITDSLPGYYNLALAGLGPLDGLKVITRLNKYPRVVLIEINLILRIESVDYNKQCLTPSSYYLNKYVPSFKEGMQPFNLAYSSLRSFLKQNESGDQQPKLDSATFAKTLKMVQGEMMIDQDTALVNNQLSSMENYIRTLEQSNVKVIFYEMPLHSSLYNLSLPNLIRSSVISRFPHTVLIPSPTDNIFKTQDAQHLDKESAVRYLKYLRERLRGT